MSLSPEILTVKTQHFEMDYVKFGSGENAFVILPGISLKPIINSAERLTQAFKNFCKDYTVYVFDRKKNIEKGYTVDAMANDTAECMIKLGISNADIFGASQGGMMALRIAEKFPFLVRRMILGSTFARPNKTSKKVLGEWSKIARSGDVVKLNRTCFKLLYTDRFISENADFFKSIEGDGTPEELERFAILCDACADFEIYDELNKISCEVLVLGCENDGILSVEGSYEIIEKLHCEHFLYKNYRHAVYDEAPDFRQRMLDFLKR